MDFKSDVLLIVSQISDILAQEPSDKSRHVLQSVVTQEELEPNNVTMETRLDVWRIVSQMLAINVLET